MHYLDIFGIGVFVGFLGGLFGKGGSAIATPLLSLVGLPGFIAVAAPLPATVPGTMIASAEYWRLHLLDTKVVVWSVIFGIPAAVLGSWLTKFTGSLPLLIVTGGLVLFFGMSFLFKPREKKSENLEDLENESARPSHYYLRLASVAVFVGLVSGMLANSGGFLLAPSFARILKMPIKKAFACSLAVSVFLAIPGTIVHAMLGHIDWIVTGVLALGSVPFSYLGARVAIHARSNRLERAYGIILTALGILFLLKL
jgi:uncharacterized membrane protein YfcA